MRAGFQQLVSRVCLGEVGAVFGLEVSRLARSSAEFGAARATRTVSSGISCAGLGHNDMTGHHLGSPRNVYYPSPCQQQPDANSDFVN